MSGATRPDKTVMSRDAVERASIREGIGRAPNMRPKDASTLIILDGHGPKAKVLMGRRHERHKFMPGLFVFPGGRVDTGDGSVTSADDLHPDVHTKLISNLRGRPSDRRARGIAHVPEDRQREGLIMDFMAWENTCFGYHHDPVYQKNGLSMNNTGIVAETEAKMGRFDVRPPNPRLTAKSFSGGNQQKIVLAREIERNPDLLLIGQPTRGVDIGAIEFIHQQIVALRDQGKAILLVSVELDEILSLSDRIAVMFDGKIMGERLPDETDEKELGLLMAGMTKGAA